MLLDCLCLCRRRRPRAMGSTGRSPPQHPDDDDGDHSALAINSESLVIIALIAGPDSRDSTPTTTIF